MNVLEKILEEIDERKLSHKQKLEIEVGGRSVGEIRERISELNWVAEIIRSYIDEYKDTNAISNDKIIENDGIDSVSKEFLKDCAETAARYKRSDRNWIPVEEGLPEETGYYLAQLSRKLPNEDYSDRVVVLFNGEEKEFMCYANLIIAWQPLPDVYKPEEKKQRK